MNLFLFIKIFVFSFFFGVQKDNAMEIHINNLTNNSGKVRLGIYNRGEDFPQERNQFKGLILEIKDKKAKIIVPDLEKGKYAIAVYHDINDNGKLDKNMFGMPTEPYGFSNNVRGVFSAPNYSDASFKVEGKTVVKIKVY
jgi:uncharacterized protein (DUF2141 family)